MERNDVIRIDGRECVSIEEFIRRVDTSRQTLEKKIRLGIIPIIHPDGKRFRYIDWELGSKAWNMNPPNRKIVDSQRKAKKSTKKDAYMNPEGNAGKARISSPKLSEVSAEDEKKEKLIDLSEIDPKLLKDCMSNGVVDWDLAKKKITAMTYAYDLDVKKGKYVEKAAVQMWAISLSKIIESNLSSIPNRYASILEAEVVSIVRKLTGKIVEVPDEDKSRIRESMDNVAPEIFKSIQKSLEEFDDEQ